MRAPQPQEWDAIMTMPTRNKQSDKYQKMLPETRALLRAFYDPYNRKLATLLQDERYLWNDSEQVATV
jgi:hypothetical protein